MPVEKQVDFPLEQLQSVLRRYFDAVRYIRKLSFGGGEPTLHKQLPELIEYTAGFRKQYEVFEIITNGAAIPSNDVLDMAEKHKDVIFFMIDNYGAPLSKKAEELSAIFSERGIRHKVRKYHGADAHAGGWVDLGDYSHKNDREKAMELLRNCCISSKIKDNTGVRQDADDGGYDSNTLFIPYAANTAGLVHRCARAYSTLQADAVPNTPENFVNIMDSTKSIEQIQEEIIAMFSSDYYRPCEYCNGFDDTSKRYEPAEQM
jgi:hypothetical protein